MRRKRDYQKKDFRNPYFSKKKSKRSRRFKFCLLIFLIIIIIGLYFLNTFDQFKITEIEIMGNEYVSQQEIENLILEQLEKKRWFFFGQDNIFFFNKRQARKELVKNYFFAELKINKKYPALIQVTVKEKISALVWTSGTDQYFLDLKGTAIRKITSEDLVIQTGEGETDIIRSEISAGNYPVIYDQSNMAVAIGQPVASQELVDFIISLTEELNEGADFDISHYNISQPDSDEITLITKEDWEVYFNINDSAKKQVDLLLSVLYQKVKNRSELEYIDLRFGEKVFWK